jgi:hypothetical protein
MQKYHAIKLLFTTPTPQVNSGLIENQLTQLIRQYCTDAL